MAKQIQVLITGALTVSLTESSEIKSQKLEDQIVETVFKLLK
jgi:hypothetical protein